MRGKKRPSNQRKKKSRKVGALTDASRTGLRVAVLLAELLRRNFWC